MKHDQTADGRGLVILLHGAWMHASSWTAWVDLFDADGYDCVVPGWPGEASTVAECRADPTAMSQVRLRELRAQIRTLVAQQPRPPIVVGHGIGSLLAHGLLGSDLQTAAVIAIAPAGTGAAVSVRPGGLKPAGPERLPAPDRFAGLFANTLSADEAERIFRKLVVPADVVRRDLAVARHPRAAGTSPSRAPALLISGGRDRLSPEAQVQALGRRDRRQHPTAISDHQIFPDRGHSLVVDAGWRDIAYFCLDWLTRQSL